VSRLRKFLKLANAENTNADLDAALDVDNADAGLTAGTANLEPIQAVQQQPLSFASQIDPNAVTIGGGNGKTATSFKLAATLTPAGGDVQTTGPNNRIAPIPPAPAL
jgi:folylpolyglutamate synthase/dihydropteroate synthase